jgi:hypothetical protein
LPSSPETAHDGQNGAHAGASPIFVLAPPFTSGALVGAVIGCNPAAFGVAELNLFVADTLEDAWLEMARHKQGQMHGLVRTVAQLVAGEQSLAAVAMARRWVMHRMHWPVARVFGEIRARAAPFRIVEKSRAHLRSPEHLKRIAEACPDAYYVHLVGDVRMEGGALAAGGEEELALFRPAAGRAQKKPELDPDRVRREVEKRIAAFLATLPAERQVELRVDELFVRPEARLAELCAALALPDDEGAVAAMLHPESSRFACIGPVGANLGDDPHFLRAPHFPAPPPAETAVGPTVSSPAPTPQ